MPRIISAGSSLAPASVAPALPDALHGKVLRDLDGWKAWLTANGVRGYVGEFGWPWNTDLASWNTLAGRYLDSLSDATLSISHKYGALTTRTVAALKEPAAIGATHAHVLAYWDQCQTTSGGALVGSVVTDLIAQITEARRLGMQVILEPALQYPPDFVKAAAPKFRQQAGTEWDDTQASGKAVRDWVWSAVGWSAVNDFLTKLMTALPIADIERIRIGGGYAGEVHYPPTIYQNPQWWGFGAAAQGTATLAPHAVVCPYPGYTPYSGGGVVQDAAWVDWYIKSFGRFVRAQLLSLRVAGFTGKLHVLYPGFQVRSNWAVDSDAYKEAASAGEDVTRQIPQHSDLAGVHPWCTWTDKDHYNGISNPTVDSDKAPWLKIKEVAVANGVATDLWGENTDAVSTAVFDQIYGPRGPVIGGYKGIMILQHDTLVASSRIGYSRFQNAANRFDRRMMATPWATGRAWGNQDGPGQHYELAQMTNLVGNQDIVATLANAKPVIDRIALARLRLGYNLSGYEFGALGVEGYSNTYQPYTITHSQADFTYLAAQGIRLVRLPMAWERMQPTLGAALNATTLSQLTTMLGYAANAGIGVILDLHNYASYGTGASGSVTVTRIARTTGTLTQAHLIDFWGRISDAFKDNPTVVGYGLMNEPTAMASEVLPDVTVYDEVLRYGFETTSPTTYEGWTATSPNTSMVRTTGDSARTGVAALQSTRSSIPASSVVEAVYQVTTPLAGGAFGGRYLSVRIKTASTAGTIGSAWKARVEYRDTDGATWVNNGTWTNLTGSMATITSTFGTPIPSTLTGLRIVIHTDNSGSATDSTFIIDEIRQERGITTLGHTALPAEVWELISQAVVASLRSTKNDAKLILVPGYQYSKIQDWLAQHTRGNWITDPLGNYRYEAHHYWDSNEDSSYGAAAYLSALTVVS